MAFHSSFDKVNSQSLVGFLFYLGNNLQFDHQGSYKPTTKIIREKQLAGKRVFWRMRGKTCTNKFFYASMSSDDLLCLASPFDVIRKFSVLTFTKAMFSAAITKGYISCEVQRFRHWLTESTNLSLLRVMVYLDKHVH